MSREEDLAREVEEIFETFRKTGKIFHNIAWETPDEILEAVRLLFGGEIDCDPASNPHAQKKIQAKTFFEDTPERDAFRWDWHGSLFLSPPYEESLIRRFCAKAVDQYRLGNVTKEVILIHSLETNSDYFQALLGECSGVCFLKNLVRWHKGHEATERVLNSVGLSDWHPQYDKRASIVFYLGPGVDKLRKIFSRFGQILAK